MLSRTRVSRAPDFSRISQAVSRPGIDPRVWSSLAVVRSVVVDAAEGPFVDVTLMPSQLDATARLGTIYAGDGFGFYAPLHVGDEVKVEAPSGDPAEGLVVSERLHSPSDPPPAAAGDHPEDLLLFVEPGKSLRVAVSGGGHLLLGGVDAASPVVLGDVLVDALREALTTGRVRCAGMPCIVDPAWVTEYLDEKATNVVSQSVYTERGEE